MTEDLPVELETPAVESPEIVDPAVGVVEQKMVPNIAEQREIIGKLIENQNNLTEGTIVYVIPKDWYERFQNTISEAETLGPVSTANILASNGSFNNINEDPYIAICSDVFFKLVDWYGLAKNCIPVSTYLIESQGQLIPEFLKPSFKLHHLSVENNSTQSHNYYNHYNYRNPTLPFFAVSCLDTCYKVLISAVKTLKNKALGSNDDLNSLKNYRIWVANDDNLDYLPYEITPSTFMDLKDKYLIKKEHFNLKLKQTKLTPNYHLIIEERVLNSKKKKLMNGDASISPNTFNYWPSFYFKHFPLIKSTGTIGLQNLGNTCYMNSALQCLVHIPELIYYFLYDSYKQELNTENPLGMEGKVATSFAKLIHNLFDDKISITNSIVPRDFKQTIGHFNSMFADYHQQDSQEFLAFLLDGLHEDLNRIIKKPITEKPELDEKFANNFNEIKKLAENSWNQHKLRNDSIILDLFVGLYKSTLICPKCSKISITFDPFNDLTLPLPVENFWSGEILLFLSTGSIKSFKVELPKTSTYQALKNYIAEKLNLNAQYLITAEIFNYQFYKNFETDSGSAYLPISDLISNNDIIMMYEIPHEEDDLIVPILNTILTPDGIPQPFAYPFFITLNEKERKSIGTIRMKIEQKYEQLSTFKYFSKVRSNAESKHFKSKDFPLLNCSAIKKSLEVDPLEAQEEIENVDNDEGDGYDSDISLANPDISIDYAFNLKLFESSRETKRKKRFYSYSENDSENLEDKVWMPISRNNLKGLPDLLDKLSDCKKSYYLYGKKFDNIDEDQSQDDVKKTEDEEVDPLQKQEEPKSPSSVIVIDDEDNDQKDNEIEDSISITLDPSIQSAISKNVLETVESSATDKEYLINKYNAIVCEWSPESFDIFFSGLESEEDGGIETWSKPEKLVNEEVEEQERKRLEQKNSKITLGDCLKMFSKTEILGEEDLWYCSNCKEHRQASKQIEIWKTPDILTIHLKRFENQRSFSDKIDAVVDFPIEGLDMSEYISNIENKDGNIYDLFAVDNHYGGLGGGHYTSYVKNVFDNKWYYFDDSRVSDSSPEKSISGAAYLLFYRKRSNDVLGGDKLIKLINESRVKAEAEKADKLKKQMEFYQENEDGGDDEVDDAGDGDDCSEGDEELQDSTVGEGEGEGEGEGDYEDEDEDEDGYESSGSVEIDSMVSSTIHVGGSNDEEESRRKIRLLNRGNSNKTAISDQQQPSDNDSHMNSLSSDDSSSYASIKQDKNTYLGSPSV